MDIAFRRRSRILRAQRKSDASRTNIKPVARLVAAIEPVLEAGRGAGPDPGEELHNVHFKGLFYVCTLKLFQQICGKIRFVYDFRDLSYPNGWEMRQDMMRYLDFTPPGVEVHCLFGSNMPTVER